MNISRFFGSTNREALRQVRMALGPDALIVSNRRVNGGVEIMATDPTSVSVEGDKVAIAPAATPPNDVMREIGALRGAFETRIDELMWGNQLRQSSHAAALFQSLLGCGFSTALLRAMLKRMPPKLSMRAAQEWVRSELTTHLPVLTSEADLWQPGLTLALVGPTGVGKTTTIAKLAARAVRRHGSQGLALLTTDTYRIGAYEQLKIYGELLRVPVKVIQNAEELANVLKAIPSHVTVLIDNVGVSQRDRYVSEQAAMLAAAQRDVRRLLVLNASSHGDTLDEVARRYSKDGGPALQGCIITKADEASSLGAALDTAVRYRLPIHYVSNGQKVPEDLLHMSADALVERAMVHEHDSKALYSPSQADFAALMSVTAVPEPALGRSAGVDRLLGALLSAEHDGQGSFQPQAFQSACDAVEDVLPVAEAWDVWNLMSDDPTLSAHGINTQIGRMLRAVRTAGHARADRPVLAVHGETPVQLHDGRNGVLRASLLLDDAGAPLISPAQQLALPDGWWSSWGAVSQQRPSPAQALALQVTSLHESRPDWSVVHTFEHGSQALWRDLTSASLNWIARIGGVTRLTHRGSLATVSAVAKSLEHDALDDRSMGPVRLGPDGSRPAHVMLWVAATAVEVNARGSDPLPLQLLSVKIVDRADGRVLKHLFGLSHMAALTPQVDLMARWLVNAYEARSVFRCVRQNWGASGPDQSGACAIPLKMLLTTQAALASWQLAREASGISATVARLAGGQKHSLSANSAALFKLFALKKWLAAEVSPP